MHRQAFWHIDTLDSYSIAAQGAPMTTTPLPKQVLSRYPSVQAWLELLGNLGRAPATLDAYGRSLAHYLLHSEESGLKPESATW